MAEQLDLSQSEYRSKKHVSASDIKLILENPYLFKIGYQRPSSSSMALGSLVHCLVIEPEQFDRDFRVYEKIPKEPEDNKIPITNGMLLQAKEIAKALFDSSISGLFKNGIGEASFFGEIEGVPCKCRPDYLIETNNRKIVVDLKTTKFGGASPDNFQRAIASYSYYIQASFYSKILNADEFVFVAIETEPPYMIGVYELDKVSLDFGMSEIKRALEIYRNLDKLENVYIDTNEYKRKQTLTLPNYVFYKNGAKI